MTGDTGQANLDAAVALLDGLRDLGLGHVCLSPGSRSTPLALALAARPGLSCTVHIDERSAAFCALGFARVSGRPAAFVCTSGTAGANAYGAVIEAHYSRVPLIVLTADRPPEWRDRGAWQTIDQGRLFGSYPRHYHEPAMPGELHTATAAAYYRDIGRRAGRRSLAPVPGPVHLNLAFREPLAPEGSWIADPSAGPPPSGTWAPDASAAPPPGGKAAPGSSIGMSLRDGMAGQRRASPEGPWQGLADRIAQSPRGLILAGLVDPPILGVDAGEYATSLAGLARATGYPILAEPAGGLRFGPHDRSHVIDGYDAFLRSPAWSRTHAPQLVLRFGASLTWRPVSEFLAAHPGAGLVVFDPLATGDDPTMTADTWLAAGAPEEADALAAAVRARGAAPEADAWLADWLSARDVAAQARVSAVADAPDATVLWLHALLPELAQPGSLIWAANSMAVRDLDSFGGQSDRPLRIVANRGAAGIDGTLSAAIGGALAHGRAGGGPTILVTGDLAFLHDVNGLGAIGLAEAGGVDLTVVVLNDRGGGIFAHLPIAEAREAVFERYFRTDPVADLAAACSMYGVAHWGAAGRGGFRAAWEATRARAGIRVIEVAVDLAANTAAHRGYWAAVAAAVGR